MDNGQNIIDKILSDAKAEAAETEKAASAEAEKIISAAQAKADKESARLEAIGTDEAQKASAKEISAAQMKAKQMILAQKQKCIENVVEQAKAKLAELSDMEYKVVVLSMVTAAKVEKGSEIILSEKDRAAFGADIENLGYKVSEETRPVESGFIIKNGDIEYNYSFESIISVEKEDIDRVVAEILFG